MLLSRAHIISRYDGTEYLAGILGTWLSPIVFDVWGYYGTYGTE